MCSDALSSHCRQEIFNCREKRPSFKQETPSREFFSGRVTSPLQPSSNRPTSSLPGECSQAHHPAPSSLPPSTLMDANRRNWGVDLQSWRPATEVPKPRPEESAGPKRGAAESAEKVLRPSSLCIAYTEARRLKHFFGTFLGTPFGTGTFRSTFSALLSGRSFGTSVAGCQDCKGRFDVNRR